MAGWLRTDPLALSDDGARIVGENRLSSSVSLSAALGVRSGSRSWSAPAVTHVPAWPNRCGGGGGGASVKHGPGGRRSQAAAGWGWRPGPTNRDDDPTASPMVNGGAPVRPHFP